MKIQTLVEIGEHKKGAIINVPEYIAFKLIELNKAKKPESKKSSK